MMEISSVWFRNLKVIEVKDRTMKEDPEKKYRVDKTLMMETYDRGEIQLMEKTCISASEYLSALFTVMPSED